MHDQLESGNADSPCDASEISRRRFFVRITVAVGAVIGALVGVPVVGFIFAPLVRPAKPLWRAVGKVDSFPIGQTVKVDFNDPSPLPWSGITAKTAAWLRRVGENEFIAFSINCRHLGCPVRWVDGAKLFMCPCHGGAYYEDGTVAAGPPPEPLARYPVRVNDGQVEIQTTAIPLTTV
ncbi:MAG TPA: ubiquinol-cytochrome c reductase iron-sulfur subunit [Tepidisphaeraceae bacterium]|nr:ubiquinol-cytochrome c reductase iron-sulfur subunit [Tepidisphaeraceae bacterium]